MSSHGLISLQNLYYGFRPLEYPIDRALIAPFWADAYLKKGGRVWYRITTENTIKQRATNDVKTYFPSRFKDFQASWIFISTWESVTFFGCSFGSGCLKVLYTKDSVIISFLFGTLSESASKLIYFCCEPVGRAQQELQLSHTIVNYIP